MLNIVIDGFDVLLSYKDQLFIFLLVIYGLGKFISGIIETLPISKFASALTVIPTGFTILNAVTFVISFTTLLSPEIFISFSSLLTVLSLTYLIYYFFKSKMARSYYLNTVLVTLLFFIILTLRLSYLDHILLPSYTDSPIHYQLTKNILDPLAAKPLMGIENITNNYYHLGFHSMTAWLSGITHLDPARAMLLIGSLGLAVAPISIAFITFVLSKNILGSLASGFVTVFGWTMPAFALNWGKFPALLALSLIPTVIGWGILIIRSSKPSIAKVFFLFIMLVSISVLHTRSIFILISSGISFLITKNMISAELLSYKKSFLYTAFFVFSLLPFESIITAFYNRLLLGIIIILLIPFGFRFHAKELSAIFIFIACVWIFNFSGKLSPVNKNVYDDQFISIMLFIPFSIISGLGISGTTKQFSTKYVFIIVSLFLLSTSYNSPWNKIIFPDPCCDFYSKADELAFQWIKENTKEDSLWIISVAQNDHYHGTDAGIWIDPLTNRHINKRMYNTDWASEKEFPNSCNLGTEDIYIYSSGGIFSFNETDILELNWVTTAYTNQSVRIYKVLSCSK